MPSMHVALPMLFVLVSWKSSLLLRSLFLVYLGFNLVGSVLLGWHYAVDGYAAILGVIVIWVGMGKLTGNHRVSLATGSTERGHPRPAR